MADDMPMAPPKAPPKVEGRDAILLTMQKAIVDFYNQHNKKKLTKSVLSILLQYWWDYGLDALNNKLESKYNTGLRIAADPLDTWHEGSGFISIVPDSKIKMKSAHNHLLVKSAVRMGVSEHFRGPMGKPIKHRKSLSARMFSSGIQNKKEGRKKPTPKGEYKPRAPSSKFKSTGQDKKPVSYSEHEDIHDYKPKKKKGQNTQKRHPKNEKRKTNRNDYKESYIFDGTYN